MRKKLIVFLLASMLLILGTSPVFASNTKSNAVVQPDFIAACPYGDGIHDMLATGVCSVLNMEETQKFFAGTYFKCTKCGELFACQGSPQTPGTPIGYYVTNGGLQVSRGTTLSKLFFTDASNVRYTNATTLEGFCSVEIV